MTAIDLAEAERLRLADQPLQQRAADAAALGLRRHIDRILDDEAVGRAWPERSGIGIAGNGAVALGDEIGKAAVGERSDSACRISSSVGGSSS